jgi:hypothetical protein
LDIKDYKASLSYGCFRRHDQLRKDLEPIPDILPDLKAVLNEPDESRVLVPYSELHDGNSEAQYQKDYTQPLLVLSNKVLEIRLTCLVL